MKQNKSVSEAVVQSARKLKITRIIGEALLTQYEFWNAISKHDTSKETRRVARQKMREIGEAIDYMEELD